MYTKNNEFIAVLKNIKPLVQEDIIQTDQYIATVEKRQEKIDIQTSFVIKIPLTYPKIQARISIHLAETEKPVKKPRVKKTPDSKPQTSSKKSQKKQNLPEATECVE
jgi:hypothetical protein